MSEHPWEFIGNHDDQFFLKKKYSISFLKIKGQEVVDEMNRLEAAVDSYKSQIERLEEANAKLENENYDLIQFVRCIRVMLTEKLNEVF